MEMEKKKKKRSVFLTNFFKSYHWIPHLRLFDSSVVDSDDEGWGYGPGRDR